MVFHYDSVHKNIAILGCIRVVWNKCVKVITFLDYFLDFKQHLTPEFGATGGNRTRILQLRRL